MAELAERNLEDMIQELEQMKRVKLFTHDETNDILKRRRQFEYSVLKRDKRIIDYQAYISYEVGLLALLKIRRKKLGYAFKKEEIEKPIMARLIRLHRQICYRFQDRLDLWMAFIRLCSVMNRHLTVSRIWTRCFQVHPRSDARLWSTAAHWFLHERPKSFAKNKLVGIIKKKRSVRQAMRSKNSIDFSKAELKELHQSLCAEEKFVGDRAAQDGMTEARHYLTQGLKNMPDSQHLYLELLKLELLNAHFIQFRQKQGDFDMTVEVDISRIADGTTVELVAMDALDKWPQDVAMMEQIMHLFDEFPDRLFPKLRDRIAHRHSEIVSTSEDSQPIPVRTENSQCDTVTQRMTLLHDTAITNGPEAALSLWKQWCSKGSQPAELFHTSAVIAMSSLACDTGSVRTNKVNMLRKDFSKGVDQWGRNSLDFWLDYIHFEEEFGDPLQVSEIDWRARNSLKPASLVADFVFKRNYQQ